MEREDKIQVILHDAYGSDVLDLCKVAIEAATFGMEVDIQIIKKIDEEVVDNNANYVLYLESSCIVGEDVIRSVRYFMEEHPNATDIGVKLIDGHGCFARESRRAPETGWDRFCIRTGLSARYPDSLLFNKSYLPQFNENRSCIVPIVDGGFLLCSNQPENLTYYLPERALTLSPRFPRKTKNKHQRLQIISFENSLEEVKAAMVKTIPGFEFVNHWNMGEKRVMDAISRINQMKGFTDITFCYPDVRFEQMWLFMDKMPNKSTHYYIYNKKSGRLLSLGKNYDSASK